MSLKCKMLILVEKEFVEILWPYSCNGIPSLAFEDILEFKLGVKATPNTCGLTPYSLF